MHDATALAAAIQDGHTTAVDVMEASLSACDALAEYGAVVHVNQEMARAGAAAADAVPQDRRGPFHGLPFLVKDLGGFAKGLSATAGCAALRRRPDEPETDSDLIRALRDTGVIPFGVTATPAFGMSLSCEPDGLPPTTNPWQSDLTAGGSSGGAAAAVAAGIVAIAHATDAAGSIRVPAACCGLTGLKPSRGAIPGGPTYGNNLMGLASELVLARSVRDVEISFRAVQSRHLTRNLPDTPRVGVAMPEPCGEDQQNAVWGMADALRDAGCEISEVTLPAALCADAQRLAWMILPISLAEWLGALDLTNDQLQPLVAAMSERARTTPVTELFAATRDVARLSFEANEVFKDLDAILMPVLSGPPPPVGTFDLTGTDVDAHLAGLAAFAPNATLANVAGLAALALPFGQSDGLPLGAQLLGPVGSDAALLELGAMVEARAPKLAFPHPIAGVPT